MVAVAIFGPSGVEISPGFAWRPASWFDSEPPEGAGMDWYGEHRRTADLENAHELGEMLVIENVRSVDHRYPDPGSLPGTYPDGDTPDWATRFDTPLAALRAGPRPTAIEALKLIDCYEYQSCEHDGWAQSEAHRFCDSLRNKLIGKVSGYDEAPWEWTQPLVTASAHQAAR